MFCINCGAQQPDGTKFCANCGAPLGAPAPATTAYSNNVPPAGPPSDDGLKWVLPIGRSGLAIAAGYAGLFAITIVLAPIALILGILALLDLKKNPKKLGRGRAWFGTIAGGLGTAFILVVIVVGLINR